MSKAAGLAQNTQSAQLEALLEITEWPDGTVNHTYLVDKRRGWLLGYRNVITDCVYAFAQPMKQFSKTKRKFKKVVDTELVMSYNV